MGFFDRFKQQPKEGRQLDHPRDLLVGDMLDFDLMSQAGLSHQSFKVDAIWTLDLGGDSHKRIYFQLRNATDMVVRLRVVDTAHFELAMPVVPEQILQVFAEQDIATILDTDSGLNHHLEPLVSESSMPEYFVGWLGDYYRQEGFELAYCYSDDYRYKSLPEYADGTEEGCDFTWLISDDRQYGLEFMVFDGGRTEAYICAYLPLRKIDALWPASTTK